jgi:DNA polymerase-3 subunit gamma/tau
MRLLVEQVRIPPQDGPYKVYIIDEVHMLSQSAFNAFLKTLEEPPAYAKFILATTEKHKILPTILSRCQVYDFKRITEQDMVKHLQYVAEQEQITAEEDALRLVAAKADGALRDALSIFDQLVTSVGKELTYQKAAAHLNVLDQENYFRITDFVFSDNVSDALLLLDDILAKGFDGQKFISGLSTHFRNLLMSMNPATLPLLEMSDAAKMQMRQQAQKCDRTLLIRALELTNQCDLNYKDANNKRLTIELCLMQINANYVYKKVRQSRERK